MGWGRRCQSGSRVIHPVLNCINSLIVQFEWRITDLSLTKLCFEGFLLILSMFWVQAAAPFGSPSHLFLKFPQPPLASSPYNMTHFRNGNSHIPTPARRTKSFDYRISRSATCIPLALSKHTILDKQNKGYIYIYTYVKQKKIYMQMYIYIYKCTCMYNVCVYRYIDQLINSWIN